MTIKTAFARFTKPDILHLYLDGTLGDDKNDGLDATRPKKSLKSIFAMFPPRFIRGDVLSEFSTSIYIHVRGTLETSEDNWIDEDLGDLYVYIDGGDEVETVAGPFDIVLAEDGLSVVKTGAGWTEDEFKGYMIKCTAGTVDLGTFRICTQNTADTLSLPYIWADVTEVTIVKPKTTLGSNTNTTPIGFNIHGTFYLSRLTINEPQFQCVISTTLNMAALVIERCAAIPFKFKGRGYLNARFYYDIDDPLMPYTAEPFMAHGLGITSSAGNTEIDHRGSFCYLYSSVIGDLTVLGGVSGSALYTGCRARKVFNRGGQATFTGGAPNWAGTKVLNSDGVGITIEHGIAASSSALAYNPTIISGAVSHAIEVRRHGVYTMGNIHGSDNGGMGLYIHDGSTVYVGRSAVTTPPTPRQPTSSIEGDLGEISIDGEFENYTWSYLEPYLSWCLGEQKEMVGIDYY